MARDKEPLKFIGNPCKGISWECTDGKYSGYGATQEEALSSWQEAKAIKMTQPPPRFGSDGKRRHW
jgi:hypothetical protein